MNRKFLSLIILLIAINGHSQKLYGIIGLNTPFSGTSYAKKYEKAEFSPRNLRINFSWGLDILYRIRNTTHKISVNEMPFGEGFKLKNKFMSPAYPGSDTLLGFLYEIYEVAIDHFIVGYSIQIDGKKPKGFLFNSKILFNYSYGLGFSLNRSKTYYRDYFSSSSGGASGNYTYYGFDINIQRKGFGIFLNGGAGFDFVDKKGKRKLCFNIFYKQGIKKMANFDIHYQYGYFNDPAKKVDVPNQKLYSNGTTFGFSLGVPIKILK